MNNRTIIIGGGISGITTALCLQLLGYETVVYAEQLVTEEAPEDPKFASLYPAASIIPHSVRSEKMDRIFPLSQQIFEFLFEAGVQGIKMHRHFEIFEEQIDEPAYAGFLKNYERVDRKTSGVPMRKNSGTVAGWAFDSLFTEWPIYIYRLYEKYREWGGKIIRKKVSAEEISALEGDVICNCTGIWSSELFEETEPLLVSKGHLVYLKDAPLIQDSNGLIPSYNYTAGSSVYSDPSGNALDVYFYPRSNGWILGGSRLEGEVDRYGRWQGKEYEGETVLIDGVKIPQPIYELNREIIQETYDLNLDDFSEVKTKIGYRYVRTRNKPGIRLESSQEHGKKIIHNYGHGGAGVTLSWGCALYIAGMLKDDINNLEELARELKNNLQKRLI
ncbi:FAD-binding oxidoreductase [Balneolaceae bacterium YR4-1]|uniref:D-amino-acid oxidase n=1 Tax=Halalkalibaculum roseum TaxID=2709311 RepID=A0A6M1STA6_9BACT|nr:FAD-dependent oxidoreductase [Halalkalibaculum roseum]NGP76032.1 FAD-binding oxidoreductase [Halalkalibaculum roseum]